MASCVRKLVEGACEPSLETSLNELVSALLTSTASDGAMTLLSSGEASFRAFDTLKVTKKQRRGIETFVTSLLRADGSAPALTVPTSSQGTVFVFSDLDARKKGCSSILVYFIARAQQLMGTLIFCRKDGEFTKSSLRSVDSTAGLLTLLIENLYYREQAKETDGIVNLDGLTGLYNHRYFQETLANELLKSQRHEHPVSLLMIDVDHFKKINDQYGHPQGDLVLKEVAEIIKKTVRSYDAAARYGGEEFAVVLPHADQAHALRVAERIRKGIARHDFRGTDGKGPAHLTISIGLACSPLNAKTKADFIDRADQALYLAKSEGRNRTCRSLASSSEPIKVGFCPASLDSAYYRDVLSGMQDVVQEIKQIELDVRAPRHESDYQMLPNLLEKIIAGRPDAVALCTQSPTATAEIRRLHQAKIPVFFFNVPERLEDKKVRCYVGYDQVEAGKAIGDYLARLLRGKGTIAVIEGLREPTSRLRVEGFQLAIAKHPDLQIIEVVSADWKGSTAKQVTARLLKEYSDLDAIFAVSDTMALGAVEAIKAKKKLGNLFVVGLDGTKDALESIKAGQLTATLDTNPKEMGRILLRTVVRSLIQEERVPGQIHSPINIITAENVELALAHLR